MTDIYAVNIMSAEVKCISPDASAATAAEIMYEHGIGSVLIVDSNRNATGIVTESDIMAAIANGIDPRNSTVDKAGTDSVITANPSTDLDQIAEQMAEYEVKKIPIVEDDSNKPVGIVTTTDLAEYFPCRTVDAG